MAKSIQAGSRILVRTAFDERLERIATSGVEHGDRFAVVWACRVEEWQAAKEEGRQPESVPWPAQDVWLAEAKGAA